MDSQPPTLGGGGGGTFQSPSLPGPTIDFLEIWRNVTDFFTNPSFGGFFEVLLVVVQLLLGIATVFFMLAIIYVVMQRSRTLQKDEMLNKPIPTKEKEDEEDDGGARPRFERVMDHLESESVSDWKIAIIEADNILFEILDRAEYQGDTLGEMLTNATTANFRTLESAWEAHKIRNKIAHESGETNLTKREARRVVGLYHQVFREFQYL